MTDQESELANILFHFCRMITVALMERHNFTAKEASRVVNGAIKTIMPDSNFNVTEELPVSKSVN